LLWTASQIHGNICLDAVVVTETLDWKLHGFDLLSEHTLQVRRPQHTATVQPASVRTLRQFGLETVQRQSAVLNVDGSTTQPQMASQQTPASDIEGFWYTEEVSTPTMPS
jgi:hypothetical protein